MLKIVDVHKAIRFESRGVARLNISPRPSRDTVIRRYSGSLTPGSDAAKTGNQNSSRYLGRTLAFPLSPRDPDIATMTLDHGFEWDALDDFRKVCVSMPGTDGSPVPLADVITKGLAESSELADAPPPRLANFLAELRAHNTELAGPENLEGVAEPVICRIDQLIDLARDVLR